VNKRNQSTKTVKEKYQKQKTWSPDNIKKTISKIREVLDPLCTAEGMELVHLECQRETGGRILRLYIDKPGGVSLDDCIHISRQSSDVLDVYLEDTGPYNLEVSSPGQNRPLGKKLDFERFKGNPVIIRTMQPIDGKKKFKGTLLGISEDMVKLSMNDEVVAIPYDEIEMGRLVGSAPQ